MTVPANAPPSLHKAYEGLTVMREKMAIMRKNQSLRGPENYAKRMAERAATHKSWRQMKGMELVMHELKHPGNRPFVIGFV